MNPSLIRWSGEYLFVLTALMLLKNVFFPFVLWWWFTAGDMAATLTEATSLIFSVIAIMVLLGMGSISRYRFGLSPVQMVAAYGAMNVPFVLFWYMPLTRSWADWWWSVSGDGIQLWFPAIAYDKGLLLFSLGIILTLAGRFVYVRDDAVQSVKVRLANRNG